MPRSPTPKDYLTIIRTLPVPQEEIDYFADIPFAKPYFGSRSAYRPVSIPRPRAKRGVCG